MIEIKDFLPPESYWTKVRVVCACRDANLHTVGDLLQKSEQEMLVLKGIGKRGIALINATLVKVGLSLKVGEKNPLSLCEQRRQRQVHHILHLLEEEREREKNIRAQIAHEHTQSAKR